MLLWIIEASGVRRETQGVCDMRSRWDSHRQGRCDSEVGAVIRRATGALTSIERHCPTAGAAVERLALE